VRPSGRTVAVSARLGGKSALSTSSNVEVGVSQVERANGLLGTGGRGCSSNTRRVYLSSMFVLYCALKPQHARAAPRVMLWVIAGITVILGSACLDRLGVPDKSPLGSLVISEENQRAGSRDWDAGLHLPWDTPVGGYALPFSLQAGETLHVFVTAPRGSVSVQIYRLGWYGGSGARLVAEHPDRSVARQPACTPASPAPSVCDWAETDRFAVDSWWVPGVYLAKFVDVLGEAGAYPFVVRSSRPAAFHVVLPFLTYQAYNNWGGTSLYYGPGSTRSEAYANRAVKVSFARPFALPDLDGQFLGIDYLLVRWLEQNAYDVTYLTDYDFHLHRGIDPEATAWLFAGHSEYWSWPMWLQANSARAQGISLGFLGGNDIYWLVRFETGSVNGLDAPVVVCYKDAAKDPMGTTPGLATTHFRSSPNNSPENSLVGVMSPGGLLVKNPPVDLVVANGSDALMAGTGLNTGEHIPGVAGWEGDRIIDNGATPNGIRVLFQSPYVPVGDSTATGLLQATIYEWPASGALVYASGEPGFARGLATYRQYVARGPIQRFLENLLHAFADARRQR